MKTATATAAAALDERIAAATAEVKALDHALQLAHGYGNYQGIQACKDAWYRSFQQLSRLIQLRRRAAK